MDPFDYVDSELFVTRRDHARLSVKGQDYGGRPDLDATLERRLLEAELEPKRYGDLLFNALFPAGDNLLTGYRESLAIARNESKRLRLRLQIATEAPLVLHDLHWELLYDVQQKIALARSQEIAFSRYMEVSLPPGRAAAGRPRLLIVLSCPRDLADYGLPTMGPVTMRRDLDRAMSPLTNLMDWEFLGGPATVERIREQLVTGKFHALHLAGHGLLLPEQTTARLALETDDRCARFIDEELFAEIFAGQRQLRLVSLIACHGGALSSQDPFSGLASALVQLGIPAVVAMRRQISLDGATRFAEHFYRNLAHGGQVDAAANEARCQLYLAESNPSEWATPTLFMRLVKGRLWEPLNDSHHGKGEKGLSHFQILGRPSRGDMREVLPTEDLKRGKLEYFRKEEAITADPAQKFQLKEQIKELQAEIDAAASSSQPAEQVWNVPFQRNEFFIGRDDVIAKLHEALNREGSAALGQAISGLGGIGKTQTAVEFSYRYRHDYRAVLWVLAETEAELTQGFVEIARQLDLPEKDAQKQELAVQAVRRWLGQEDGWLLVLDNADTPSIIKPYLPTPPKGHVLLTSRASSFDILHMEPFKLEVLSQDEAFRFLLSRARREGVPEQEREAALELAHDLGYLPLALEQAVAFISLHQSRFADYLVSYRRRRLQLLSEGPLRDYREPLATTWSLNFEEVAAASEASAEILRMSALLSPDQIPEELLIHGADEFGVALSEALRGYEKDRLILDKLLQPLSRYSLIERDREVAMERDRRVATFSVHRMVQEVVRQSLEEPEERRIAENLVGALSQTYTDQDVTNWPLYDRLVPHWRITADTITRLELESHAAGTVLQQAGFYAKERARYSEAAMFYERSLQIYEKVLDEEHLDVATCLNNLAMLHEDRGEYAQVAMLYERSLQIYEKVLGREHPNVATSLNNLARLHKNQGNYTQATKLLKRALEIREKALDTDHPAVATCLNNLATLYKDQGEYTQAETLYERAFKIWKKALGEEHLKVATSLNNLAMLQHAQGDYEQAEPLLVRALKIREKTLGEEHPIFATSLNNLAKLRRAQGDHSQAETLFKRAREIQEKALGEEHPKVAQSLIDLAELYVARAKPAQASPLYERALKIREKVFGEEHPFTEEIRASYCDNEEMQLEKAKRRITEIEPMLAEHPFVEMCALERNGRQLHLALTDRLRRRAKRGRVWKSKPFLTALKNAEYGFDPQLARSSSGRDGLFLLDRTFKPANAMMRKIFGGYLDKSGSSAGDIASALGTTLEKLQAVRLVSHHMRLLGVLWQSKASDWVVLVDYDNTK